MGPHLAVGGRKGDEYGCRGAHRWGESEGNETRDRMKTSHESSCRLQKTCLLLREIGSHWGVRSTGVTWLTWLPFNKITSLFVRTDWREQVEKQEGCWEDEGGGSDEVRAGDGDVRWERGDRFWVYFEVEPIGFAESVGYGVRDRSWGWLQSCWSFWRKESSTGMKHCW